MLDLFPDVLLDIIISYMLDECDTRLDRYHLLYYVIHDPDVEYIMDEVDSTIGELLEYKNTKVIHIFESIHIISGSIFNETKEQPIYARIVPISEPIMKSDYNDKIISALVSNSNKFKRYMPEGYDNYPNIDKSTLEYMIDSLHLSCKYHTTVLSNHEMLTRESAFDWFSYRVNLKLIISDDFYKRHIEFMKMKLLFATS